MHKFECFDHHSLHFYSSVFSLLIRNECGKVLGITSIHTFSGWPLDSMLIILYLFLMFHAS